MVLVCAFLFPLPPPFTGAPLFGAVYLLPPTRHLLKDLLHFTSFSFVFLASLILLNLLLSLFYNLKLSKGSYTKEYITYT